MRQLLMRLALAVLGLILGVSAATAQICEGASSFQGAPFQIGTGASLQTDTRGVSGLIGAGNDLLFGIGTVSLGTTDNADATWRSLKFALGSDRPFGRLYICPLLGLERTWGPRVGLNEFSRWGYGVGGSAGFVLGDLKTFAVIPTISYVAGRGRLRVERGPIATTVGTDSGRVVGGVGFVVRDRLGIASLLAVPVGTEGDQPNAVQLGLTYNF